MFHVALIVFSGVIVKSGTESSLQIKYSNSSQLDTIWSVVSSDIQYLLCFQYSSSVLIGRSNDKMNSHEVI